MQIQDIFCGTPLAAAKLEGLETPFAKLAGEDEARFKKDLRDEPLARQIAVPKSLDEEPHTANPPPNGASADIESHLARSEQPKLAVERLESAPEFRNAPASTPSSQPEVRHVQIRSSHREGHERLQELYLTDEPLDGAKIADLVFQLPRVTGVAIMLSDGAVLGAELGGGISEKLLGLAPDFLKHVSGLTEMIPGGPTRFITFFGYALQISLVIRGCPTPIGHEGKNLPPGLRERLIATTQALNDFYGPQP